jgi:hypothetical protein
MSIRTKEDLMRAVVASKVNLIPVAASDTPDAFVEAASNWLGKWWRLRPGWQQVTSGYCALVFEPEFEGKPAAANFSLARLFRDAPTASLGGAIYVSDGALAKVLRQQGTFPDASALIAGLEAAGLADRPAVLFEPEVGVILLAHKGVREPCVRLQFGAFDANLTVANVDKLLTELYTTTLKYPETFPHVWAKASQFIPMAYAEKFFQGVALIHLRAMAQENWTVRPEDNTNAGRADLAISTTTPACVFVVEIKVLKSFHYNAEGRLRAFDATENEDWANDGIRQVIDYRMARQAAEAFLLLYDMRKNDADIAVVTKRCTKEHVLLRRYFIHNQSASKIRKAAKKKR